MSLRAFLPLALIAGLFATLAMAPVAVAQDPTCDQYCPEPTEPGNDPVPDNNEDPVTSAGSGSDDTSDDGSAGATGSADTPAPPSAEPATAPEITGATGGNGGGGNKGRQNGDDRTLEGIAANAEQARSDRGSTATQLSSETSDGGSSGIGWLIWVVLGAIALWAIAYGVITYRRRKDESRSTKDSHRRSGERQTA